MNTVDMVILGCALVTFIPRLIPSIFVGQINFSKKTEKFLDLIPYSDEFGKNAADNKPFYELKKTGFLGLFKK